MRLISPSLFQGHCDAGCFFFIFDFLFKTVTQLPPRPWLLNSTKHNELFTQHSGLGLVRRRTQLICCYRTQGSLTEWEHQRRPVLRAAMRLLSYMYALVLVYPCCGCHSSGSIYICQGRNVEHVPKDIPKNATEV